MESTEIIALVVVAVMLLALSEDPQSARAWQTGARGEVVLGRRLDSLRERGIQVLHDRRIPGTKANIDHIVVSPRGVFVIDAKKYSGAPSLRVEGGLFRPRVESLIIGSRDRTHLVHGVVNQVGPVSDALARSGRPHGTDPARRAGGHGCSPSHRHD